jgi:hypothetical protein
MTTALADQEATQGFGNRPTWQMPYSSQSWTRDNYALNSPYPFLDLTGYQWQVLADEGYETLANAARSDELMYRSIE